MGRKPEVKVYRLDNMIVAGERPMCLIEEFTETNEQSANNWIESKGRNNANYIILEVYNGKVSNIH